MYRPIQPGITSHSTASGLCYNEFSPHPNLQPYIHCYWHIESTGELSKPFTYRVIPDGCVDVLMNVSDYEGAVIATTMRLPAYVPFAGKTQYIGIRFLPGCANLFLKAPLPEILDEMVLVKDADIKHDEALEACLFETTEMRVRIQSLNEYLLAKLYNAPNRPDKRVLQALSAIYQAQGNLASQSLSGLVSSRHLRRLFQTATGASPKTISRVIRFQTLIKSMLQTPNTFQPAAGFDVGYYDQSHFNREFKALYGETPGGFLRSLQLNLTQTETL